MENQKICGSCQRENKASSSFCKFCGSALNNPVHIPEQTPEEQQYNRGLEAFSLGQLEAALVIFQEIRSYKDSSEKIQLITKIMAEQKEKQANQIEQAYQHGLDCFSTGKLVDAQRQFQQLGDYKESKQKLQLIEGILLKQAKNQREQRVNDLFEMAQQTDTLTELEGAIVELQHLGIDEASLQPLFLRHQELLSIENEQSNLKKKKIKIYGASVVGLVLAATLIFFMVTNHQENVATLEKSVTTQREINRETYDILDETVQKEMEEMFSSYNAHVNDYSYKVKKETADYILIDYTFKGPDQTKDLLPKKGTRLYGQVSLTRE